jgi:WhiB family redox-sensing transcriptional regulator
MPAGHYDRTRIPRRGRPGFLRAILGDLDRDWMAEALCGMLAPAEVDEIFFPVNGRSNVAKRDYERRVSRAKNVCRLCPVIAECEAYRVSLQTEYGVWGGRDEKDRATTRLHVVKGNT